MSQQTYDVIVRLVDGKEIIITKATWYTWNNEKGCAVVEKNGHAFVFNCQNVVYIGRYFDLIN